MSRARLKCGRFLAAAAAVGAAVCSAAAPPPPESDGGATEELADRLLGEAQSAGEAALRWLERQTGVTERDVEDGVADAQERLRRAIADAVERSGEGRAAGVRLLDMEKTQRRPAWEPLAAPGEAIMQVVPAELVLLVHGLDEPGGIWDDLAPALGRAGLEVARFDYPNDQPLARSAEMLAEALADLRARGVRRVDLVAHSAGGLVARDVLTRVEAGMYGGRPRGHESLPDVGRLIMFGTPNGGAPLARLQAVSEIREQFVRWIESDGNDPAALLGFLRDGDGEAATDLLPGSAYLEELNARPLPIGAGGGDGGDGGDGGVELTVVVGTMARGPSEELAGVLDWPLVRRALGPGKLQEAEAGIAQLSGTLGDGVVPASSQLLPGVEDVVRIEANHRSMLKRIEVPGIPDRFRTEQADPPAIDIVLERLRP